MKTAKELKDEIFKQVEQYYELQHHQNDAWQPGKVIHYGGRIFNAQEMKNLVDASLDFWLTNGEYSQKFEKQLADWLGVTYCYSCNSGSSANLLAFMALTAQELGDRKINRGDEVITVAAGFPTTISPIIQFGAVPVFVDITVPSYNIDCSQLKQALSPKTKAVMLAHTLGNPFNVKEVVEFCQKNQLWLIEDNCDAIGAKYYLNENWGYTGTFGDIGTSSFYPAHHITMGEGGAVYTKDPLLAKILLSLRDWGRDCRCPSGVDNFCGNRFNQQYGELPFGYDHKYVYSRFGYNLKLTEMQASVGCAQLEKLPQFIQKRKANWEYLKTQLECLQDYFILPEKEDGCDPSWFGFVIGIKDKNGLSRDTVIQFLEGKGIQTRMLFSGNLIKHPCFNEMRQSGNGFRQIGGLANTDYVMNNVFWIGVYPGITQKMLDYIVTQFKSLINLIGNKQ